MYYFSFFLFAYGGFLSISNKLNRRSVYGILAIFVMWMVIHDGLRWGIATDWRPYLDYFENCLWQNAENFEWGYCKVSILIRSFTDSYSVFLVLHALFVYVSFYWLIKRYSCYPLVSFLILYYSMIGYLGMNRQYIALMMCLLSIPLLLKKKYVKFLCLVALASLFHVSALLFCVVIFLNHRFRSSILWLVLLGVVLIALSGMINKLPLNLFLLLGEGSGNKVELYMSSGDDIKSSLSVTLLGIIRRSFWIVLLLYYRNKVSVEYKYFNLMFNISFIALVFYVLFSGTILQVIVSRGLIYFNIFEVFLIPFIFLGIKRKIVKQLSYMLLLIWGIYTLNKSMDFYKGSREVEDIYRPYNAIYLDPNYDATGYTFETY